MIARNQEETMGLFDMVMKQMSGDAELLAIDDKQGEAIIEALIAAVFVDGEAAAHELVEFEKQMSTIPWAQRRSDAEKKRLAREAMAKVKAALASKTSAGWFLQNVATALGTQTLREKVYKMAVAISMADHRAAPEEQALLANLAGAFGIDGPRAAALWKEASA
jgi:tellurite resistance protein